MKFDIVRRRRILQLQTGMIVAALGIISACSLIDEHRDIYGTWRAEKLEFAGIAIPIAPTIEFRREFVVIDGKIQGLESYEKTGNLITVHMKDSASLTFEMLTKRSMTLDVLFIGKIKYAKISD